MYSQPPSSRPEPTWSNPASNPRIQSPSYLPQPVPPQVAQLQAAQAQALRQWVRIPTVRPVVTPVVLGVLVLVYLPALVAPRVYESMLAWGANVPALVAHGEWWRLITSTFLHGPIIHIALNAMSLYMVGMYLENLIGRARFAAVYAISGLAGSVASFAFSPSYVSSVGASGAIFGVVGALAVYFGLHRRIFGRTGNLQFWNIVIVIAINLGIGFSGAFPIDNSAHLGGLLAGLATGYALCPRYALGGWVNPSVRTLVDTNKGKAPWIATGLIGLVVLLVFLDFLLSGRVS